MDRSDSLQLLFGILQNLKVLATLSPSKQAASLNYSLDNIPWTGSPDFQKIMNLGLLFTSIKNISTKHLT